tara:strand:- start:298 stop:477 length:180 start_codon:yes stop_codon:yes gene_type:complete
LVINLEELIEQSVTKGLIDLVVDEEGNFHYKLSEAGMEKAKQILKDRLMSDDDSQSEQG